MIEFLLAQALKRHEKLNAAKGIRDIGLIESAINAPFQTFGGQDLYPTIFDKATQLFYGLTKNHGFVDGNKRLALHVTEIFLRVNNFVLRCSQDKLVEVSLKVAASQISVDELKFWLLRHSA
ncbi:MAG: type II toxin-antitoxin system death-on-curing family toxin, partial [Selenomonadaceae bacterium]|nr:type II toxin-antitoxin system death-on-curing family toxin [Selenomonadaceae bacterium]